jgi:filamentous hemagglutinin family protein
MLHCKLSALSIFSLLLLIPQPQTLAQITPDRTLSTTVLTTDRQNFVIENGERQGNHLFHSFENFSVPTGGSAIFNNAPEIQTIFSRVTGQNISNIDGLIRANGTANLFLLNPNGIILGENSRLEIGGSFVGSTAESIRFADGGEFSSVSSAVPLTLSVPIGLQYGSRSGNIVSNGNLTVQPGRTLGLLGGAVIVKGGSLNAPQGAVTLGAIQPGMSAVALKTEGLNFDFGGVRAFDRIDILNRATVNVTAAGSGGITLVGGRVALTGGATLQANTLGAIDGQGINIQASRLTIGNGSSVASNSLGAGAAGNINIRASQQFNLGGAGVIDLQQRLLPLLEGNSDGLRLTQGNLSSLGTGTGAAGDIRIQTPRLQARSGALISTSTLGQGSGGDLMITAPDRAVVSGSAIVSGTLGSGAAGRIRIRGGGVIVSDGSLLASASLNSGRGGDIQVRADEIAVLRTANGFLGDSLAASVITSNSIGGSGPAGNITLTARRFRVAQGGIVATGSGIYGNEGRLRNFNGGRGGNLTIRADTVDLIGRSPDDRFPSILESRTLSPSSAGNIRIDTGQLNIRNGALITSDTSNAGQGGSINIDADTVALSGRPDLQIRSGLFASSGVAGRNLRATGRAGNIRVTTDRLHVNDNAQISVDSLYQADAGIVQIRADHIRLSQNGQINATTASGEGGNIRLQNTGLLRLEDSSRISATAGGSGNGGNISLTSPWIIATRNSDIIANALKGQGGNIQIETSGLFGAEFRPQVTPESDITASSEFGVSGQVSISRLAIDPNSGLVALPMVIDSSQQISTACSDTQSNQFVITGRGGIPENPAASLRTNRVWGDLRDLTPYRMQLSQSTQAPALVEATAWTKDEQGNIVLTAMESDVLRRSPETCAHSG